MHEIELKFQIPEAGRQALRRTVATLAAQRTHLRAQYHDTPDRLLARSGFALRLRLEGDRWVQTLKGGGDGLMQRLEHNAPVDCPPTGEPVLDLHRHDGTPAGVALRAVLDRLGIGAADLRLQYRTDIVRTHRVLTHAGASVELALDEGEITGGERGRVEVHEIEMELVEGSPSALLDLARLWVPEYGLWLDVRTKAERGDRLARGLQAGAPVPSSVQVPEPGLAPAQMQAASLRHRLRHVLPNASELAAGTGGAGHVDELRAGLEGLRDLWQGQDLRVGQVSDLIDALAAGPAPIEVHLRAAAVQDLWLEALRLTLPDPV